MQKLWFEWIIDLSAEPSHLHVNDIIDLGEPIVVSPNISCQHFTRDRPVTVLDQVEQNVEFLLAES
jgi:hypothetical protein